MSNEQNQDNNNNDEVVETKETYEETTKVEKKFAKYSKFAILAVFVFHFGNNDVTNHLFLTIRQENSGKIQLVCDLKNIRRN